MTFNSLSDFLWKNLMEDGGVEIFGVEVLLSVCVAVELVSSVLTTAQSNSECKTSHHLLWHIQRLRDEPSF
jgi:hypothetical protein